MTILSICIPTYNRENHIKRQIKYFVEELAHIENNLVEIIISNNASKDGTFGYLEALKGKYEWLFINHNDRNIGGFNNMKKLMYMARGTYIWIPGDDDYLKKGVISRILNIIEEFKPSYIYLSRRTIKEETQIITLEGKKHPVNYDHLTRIEHNELLHLLIENYSDLKFQTSSIFIKEKCLEYDEEAKVVLKQLARESCHSLFKSIRAIQDGTSYFVSDIEILSGDQISWESNIIDNVSVADYDFSNGLTSFGFTKKECNRIVKRQMASASITYLMNKHLLMEWIRRGKPGFNWNQIPSILFLLFRKIKRVIWKSKAYITLDVNINDFI